MLRDDLRTGAQAGILSATATAGALIAIGSRANTVSRPFNVIAAHLLGARADAFGFVASVTILGVLVHLVILTVAGVATASVHRHAHIPAWVAAAVITALSALVSIGVARRGGASLAGLLTLGDLLLYYLVMAGSLVAGIRFAFSLRHPHRLPHHDLM